jgi:uncharacterized membrane protein
MTRCEINERDRSRLVTELSSWVAQGLIGGDQAARIIDVYQTTDELGRRHSGRGIQILSGLAALLVGLAVLLLVGFNWDALPDSLKLAAACGAIAATHAAGCCVRDRLRRRGESEVLFFIACTFFGSGIWLVAQVFNLSSNNSEQRGFQAVRVRPEVQNFRNKSLSVPAESIRNAAHVESDNTNGEKLGIVVPFFDQRADCDLELSEGWDGDDGIAPSG